MAKLSPLFNDAQLIDGIPASGGLLFTYAAGSSTKQTTYKDEDGAIAQANPIVLNARGEVDSPIWLTEGLSYKFVFAPSDDTDPPASPIRTIDDITGTNDASISISQWIDSGSTPTYVNTTQFTLSGDQTSNFTVNRRIKATVTAGTVYGYISASAYTSLTTVTVVLDSGDLDVGLSAVQLGLITPNNTSIRVGTDAIVDESITEEKLADDSVSTTKIIDENITLPKLAPSAKTGKIQPITASVASNALTITLNPTTLDFRNSTLGSGNINTRNISSPISVVVSSGSTLGTVNNVLNRIAVLAIDNSGTIELAVTNLAGGTNLDETGLISTTAEGGAGGADSATVIYSTSARSNVAYRLVGFIESTQSTAGTWATAPSKIQGYGGQAFYSLISIGYSQTWQDVTGSRSSATTYTNTTGKPIMVALRLGTGGTTTAITVQGLNILNTSTATAYLTTFIVPVGADYSVTWGSTGVVAWSELR